MKYSEKERIEIGRRVYSGELSRFEAGEEYGISPDTARNYMRLYRDAYGLPAKRGKRRNYAAAPAGLADYESMTREELIHELLMARINEARLKKGYEVKGDGTVILYGNGNTK